MLVKAPLAQRAAAGSSGKGAKGKGPKSKGKTKGAGEGKGKRKNQGNRSGGGWQAVGGGATQTLLGTDWQAFHLARQAKRTHCAWVEVPRRTKMCFTQQMDKPRLTKKNKCILVLSKDFGPTFC